MSFACPECRRPDTLAIEGAIELPADGRSDEIALQTLVCRACGFRALGVYEESRRGALDAESWDHTGYRAAPETLAAIARRIAACPRPGDAGCACPGHAELARVDARGRWRAPLGLDESFALRRAEKGK